MPVFRAFLTNNIAKKLKCGNIYNVLINFKAHEKVHEFSHF